MIKKAGQTFSSRGKNNSPYFNLASIPHRLFQKWTNLNFRALNVNFVILKSRLECVEKPNGNEECSFIDAVCIPGASRCEQQGIHSHNWFSTRDLNTASQWQADNSANFSLHGLWMVQYDRLVESDWWLGLNNSAVHAPPPRAQRPADTQNATRQ